MMTRQSLTVRRMTRLAQPARALDCDGTAGFSALIDAAFLIFLGFAVLAFAGLLESFGSLRFAGFDLRRAKALVRFEMGGGSI